MADVESRSEVVASLAEEFVERYRRGERPPISEYARKFPDLEAEIRDVFPAVAMVENLAPARDASIAAGSKPDALVGSPDARVEQVGEFRILREVGRGGMGVVYEAEQLSLGRRVALKVLARQSLPDAHHRERFEREARAAARLHHTNIVPVFGVGEQDGLQFYVMQFIQGLGLDEVIDELRRMQAGRQPGAASEPAGELRISRRCEASAVARSLVSGDFQRAPAGQQASEVGGPNSEVGDRTSKLSEKPGISGETGHLSAGTSTPSGRLSDSFVLSGSSASGLSQDVDAPRVSHESYWQSIARIGAQVADAIQYAHDQGVLHRDIKPSNLLLDVRGTVWITDFGLAKANDQQNLTHPGDIVGTLRYMPPEAFEGSADARGDVYSLGITLYELLGLRHAFSEGDRAQLIRLVTTTEPRRLDRVNPAVPRDLAMVVHKAIDREPRLRYQTARELAEDLHRFLADRPVRARPLSTRERTWRWCRRNRPVAILTAVIAGVLLLSAAGGLILSLYLWDALDRERAAKAETSDKLWLAHYERARAGRFSRRMGQRTETLLAAGEAARIRPDDRLRDEAIAALALPDVCPGPLLKTPISEPRGFAGLAFDADYRVYARREAAGIISICEVQGQRELQRIETGLDSLRLVMSPDGAHVAQIDAWSSLRMWRVADRPENRQGRLILKLELDNCRNVVFSPTAPIIAAAGEGRIVCFELDSGRVRNEWPAEGHGLAFHPDGRRIAVGFVSSKVAAVYEASSGTLLAELPLDSDVNEQVVAWHPDGRRLAVAGTDARIQVWDVDRIRRVAVCEGHTQNVTRLSFHPDGGLLASRSWDGTLRLWEPDTGRQLMQLAMLAEPTFSRDGRWLGIGWSGGTQVQLLEAVPSREYRTIVSGLGARTGGYYEGDICPDGRLVALGMSDGFRLWELSSGRELAFVAGDRVRCVTFFPGGDGLLTCGLDGLRRWPLRSDPARPGMLRLGPPLAIPVPAPPERVCIDASGSTAAVVSESGGATWIIELSTGAVRGPALNHANAGFVALSADGRWIATAGWHSEFVRLWDAREGRLIEEWAPEPFDANQVWFTPDSRELLICRGDQIIFKDLATLSSRHLDRERSHYPAFSVAFADEGRLMAVEMAPGVVHLKDVRTGRTVARLEDPHGDPARWLGFTPDGTQLVVSSEFAIHVWDLRAIRHELKAIGLDWDWPEFSRSAPDAHAAEAERLQIQVVDPVDGGQAMDDA